MRRIVCCSCKADFGERDVSGVGYLSEWFGVKMYEEYERPVHPLLKWRTMESPPQELDEEKLDAAIADLLNEQRQSEDRTVATLRPEFPILIPQEDVTAQAAMKDKRLSAVLRQKWAELSGAA
ncbi:hypothetical protein [uncultured Ruegeria sp.]|uniref:hypothetical protein n=1 Tax=uncultured Ruegeria sp. TaxID=259304 RepID=UPI0026110CB4|nr:hypothetical protein [uncultured Ruegeria sp.]